MNDDSEGLNQTVLTPATHVELAEKGVFSLNFSP
jgi:hypothetical protein